MAWRLAGLLLSSWIVITTVLSMAGCATAGGEGPKGVAVQCLPLKTYSKADEAAVAEALAALPPGSPLIGFIIDYGAMRAADRACMESAP